MNVIRYAPLRRSSWLLALAIAACADSETQPTPMPTPAPVARVDIVEDRYFDTIVADPYRWMETPDSVELAQWLRAQNDHTRQTLDRLAAPRSELLQRIRTLQAGTAAVRFVSRVGADYFYFETPVDDSRARLMRRPAEGGAARVLVDPARWPDRTQRITVDFHRPAPDGRHVAFVVSEGGAEDWVLHVVDSSHGRLLPDRVPDIVSPMPSWAADGKGFYYLRYQDLPPDAPPSAKYENLRVHFHVLGSPAEEDRAVFGPGVDSEIQLPSGPVFPQVDATVDGRWLVASLNQGTDSARAYWLRDLHADRPSWRAVAAREEGVTQLLVVGDHVFAIVQGQDPDGRIVRFRARDQVLADAETWLPPGDVVIAADSGFIAAARDGLYVAGMRDGLSIVRRLAFRRAGEIGEMPLPAAGGLIEFSADRTIDGISFALQAPTLSPRIYRYDPASGQSIDTGLRAADPADFSDIVTRRFEVPSSGGVRVPLTLTARRDLELDGGNPVLLVVYGSYGVIVPMWFSAPDLAWYERGGAIAFVHARGGGEKGAAWHEAGRRANKQRTVDDTIAAAQWLIDQGWTSPARLAIAGKSAGGIPVGGAITQRPELFRAALFRVGVTDMLRIEHSSGGPANTMEYGTSGIEAEFRALAALSPYNRVREGVAYPAVMLETGINDPRVPPWQLAKMAARLQAATASGHPILLRVDYRAGHGLGSDRDQIAELLADEFSFLGWQLGMPGFAPAAH